MDTMGWLLARTRQASSHFVAGSSMSSIGLDSFEYQSCISSVDEHRTLASLRNNLTIGTVSQASSLDGSVVTPTAMQALPHEILVIILDQLDADTEKQELRNLRKTCRALASLAAPYLFREVMPYFIGYHLMALTEIET